MLECEVAMMESANSGSLVNQSDLTELKGMSTIIHKFSFYYLTNYVY